MALGSRRLLAAALLAVALPASAHRLQFPKQVRLRVSPGAVEVIVSYDLDEGSEAEQVRDRIDADGDGVADAAEMERSRAHLVSRLRRTMTLAANGEPLALQVHSVATEGLEQHGGEALRIGITVVLRGELPGRGGVDVRFSDRVEAGDHDVPVSVTVEGYALEGSSGGRVETGPEPGRTRVLGVLLGSGQDLSLRLRGGGP